MDSSDTRDLDYKTRDWKYTQPLQTRLLSLISKSRIRSYGAVVAQQIANLLVLSSILSASCSFVFLKKNFCAWSGFHPLVILTSLLGQITTEASVV